MMTLSYGLVLISVIVLVWSLVPTSRLIRRLPRCPTRVRWKLLFASIVVFIVGYLGFFGFGLRGVILLKDLIVPVIFLLGACFVLIIAYLSIDAVEAVRRVGELEIENATDPLMGIYNRRHFDQRMREETARARRYNLALSLLMADIDHFKKINDTYGHQAGDVVLAGIAALFSREVRKSDILARYGGEEVVIISTNTNLDGARVLAERIRTRVEASAFPTGDRGVTQSIRCTVSIGVAILSGGSGGPEALLAAADAALYRAKEKGRNRVEVQPAPGGPSPA
jgi:diguanylate cyclase (GGDEF)-like protein